MTATHAVVKPSAETPPSRKTPKIVTAASGPLVEAGEMVQLLHRVLVSAIRHPIGYWGEVRDQMFDILKLCWIPMIVSTTAFGLGAPGLQGGNIFMLFGIPERLGSFFIMASVREFAPWINAMVVAGVIGTAMTADLGARRIREEIDAMEVLGVDPIRTLVLPRVIAVTVMTGLLDLVALVFGVIGGYIASVVMLGANSSAFFASFFDNATTTDIWASVAKTTLFGLIIGVVCCYKGLHAGGGPIGVGRAVNQAVVIAFAAIWIFNYVFTTILLGLNPNMQVYK
jgi:phospholipid/cholesterol/gamma-HCH transport system permease protein